MYILNGNNKHSATALLQKRGETLLTSATEFPYPTDKVGMGGWVVEKKERQHVLSENTLKGYERNILL